MHLKIVNKIPNATVIIERQSRRALLKLKGSRRLKESVSLPQFIFRLHHPMPLSKDDPFAPTLRKILSGACDPDIFIYPDERFAVAKKNIPYEARHVADNLILKHVRPAPFLAEKLALLCDKSIDEFLAAGHTFDASKFPYYEQVSTYIGTLNDVSRYYNNPIGYRCRSLASKLMFFRNTPYWVPLLVGPSAWENAFMADAQVDINDSLRMDLSLNAGSSESNLPEDDTPVPGEIPLPKVIRDSLDDWVMPTLSKLNSLEALALWNFFAPTKQAENLLHKMGDMDSNFEWEKPSTKGFPTTTTATPPRVPLDAPCTSFLLPSKISLKSKTTAHKASKKIVPPTQKAENRDIHYRPNPSHFLQTMWYCAVSKDSTFIVMNCGTFERIGVRHRGSQTLYLSDIIDPRREGYGRIHTGLVLAILHDAIDRVWKVRPVSNHLPRPERMVGNPKMEKKRRRGAGPLRKRQIITRREGYLLSDHQLIDDEIGKRGILTLVFETDILRSPAPSVLHRLGPPCIARLHQPNFRSPIRKSEYNPEDYITVIIRDPPLGTGASGIVFRVSVEIQTRSGATMTKEIVLKFSHWNTNPGELFHEYAIYDQLMSRNVSKGIIGVYGLFEDLDTRTAAILMDDAGKSLSQVREEALEELGEDVKYEEIPPAGNFLTEAQRCEFLDILKELHASSFLHGDIRRQNLMIDSVGDARIVDFGRAMFPSAATADEYQEELEELLEILGLESSTSD
ncbi:hypothetical protein CPC08DRAFT_319668 [Agrocybe pediades]|nr:hypothetical protein CPC08DRAFT_319668 [Agrocybe pediades]